MSFASRLVDPTPMLAWVAGTLVALVIVMGVGLAIYAVYWFIFKLK